MTFHSRDTFRKKLRSLVTQTSFRPVGLGISSLLLVQLAFGLAPLSVRAQTPVTSDHGAQDAGRASTARPALDFKLYRGYLIVVTGSVGGLKNLHFIVDTSTSPSIADCRLVEKLGIRQHSGIVSVPGEIVGAGRAVLTDVQVGPIAAKSLPVLAVDLSGLGRALGTHIDMLIGFDVLGQSSFTIDYRAKRILFGAPPTLPLAVPMDSGPPLVSVITLLDGRALRLLVNTGFPDIMLEEESGERIQNVKIGQSRLAINAAGGEVVCKRGTVQSVRLGEIDLGGQSVVSVSQGRKEFDGSLPITPRFKEVAFDFEHHILGLRK
jgi:hypothetical protein